MRTHWSEKLVQLLCFAFYYLILAPIMYAVLGLYWLGLQLAGLANSLFNRMREVRNILAKNKNKNKNKN